MKKYFFIALLLNIVAVCNAQPVIYKCMNYEFKDEKDPSKDKIETDVSFISLDLNSQSNPCLTLTLNQEAEKPEDIVMKWNIVNNLGVTPGTPKNITKTTYTVRREVLGVEEPELFYLYKTDDNTINTIDITISDLKGKTTWNFYALMKE
jgi:hypothetical protein